MDDFLEGLKLWAFFFGLIFALSLLAWWYLATGARIQPRTHRARRARGGGRSRSVTRIR